MSSGTVPSRLIVMGDNTTRLWGLSSYERIERLADKAGVGGPKADTTSLWADQGYAFDPLWMTHAMATPRLWVMHGDRPVLVRDEAALLPRIAGEAMLPPEGASVYRIEDRPTLYNESLRKQQQPFFEPLVPGNVARLERESYYGAYKGVTDILTKYLWPELAFHLTRLAARLRMTPNMVTVLGAIGCIAATFFFLYGHYWAGVAVGFVFMVFDTVDGKLARCTVTSSFWGNIFDHGIDLVHPPFWWVAWALGLSHHGLAYSATTFGWVTGTILIGYVVQRLIEGWFIKRFGFHIHVWRKFDSDFRLVTARRNPNMILLVGSLVFGRPDIGLILVAWWTGLSLLVHFWQVITAELQQARGEPVTSWLEG
ncbi:CDP-alcohol phosphatidyltransferase family protein [Stakelama pacifica]|uniref:Phosphatidylglycerophosphate synthase n=1 Tax=Stakelama pacifica TaxID=517720 RepID=A0A4R6FSA5_9SPHN|nr:CDP-alcohol phosphatidyltransferase family protein [Stakelama pacifica]TDN83655.1 phosphatidylglycerophosphate synthase [Stakelama pacifica]